MNSELLKKKIDESGYKHNFIAYSLGLSLPTYRTRISGDSEWKLSEIQTICSILKLSKSESEKIFPLNVYKK